MGQGNDPIQALPITQGGDEPTLGAIKRALHDLSRNPARSGRRDNGAALREAHELLRSLALRNGIGPEHAVRQQLAAVELLRQRMVLAGAGAASHLSP